MLQRRSSKIVPWLFVALSAPSATAQYGVTTRISVGPGGAQVDLTSYWGRLTADGRYVAFNSYAHHLTGTPVSGPQSYLHDRTTQLNELISVSAAGVHANDWSNPTSITPDARFVAFSSPAANLVSLDTNGVIDCFVRDRQMQTTTRVSVSAFGVQGNGGANFACLSDDGARVAFVSYSTNLVPGDTNARGDVFLKQLPGGALTRLTVGLGGAQSNGDALYASATADLSYVAYTNSATNLVAGDVNGFTDVFVTEVTSGVTRRVSVSSSGGEADGVSDRPVLARNGAAIVFSSTASNLVPGDTNGQVDVFVHELVSGVTSRASISSGGAQLAGPSQYPQISGDGRMLSFMSWDDGVLPGDTNGAGDSFVLDRLTGTVSCASLGYNGQFVGAGGDPWMHLATSLSHDGRYVCLYSEGANLVINDTNHASDVFVRDLLGSVAPVAYCTAATTSGGCVPQLSADANPSASFATACSLSLQSVDAQTSGLLFYGIDNNGFVFQPWLGGPTYLCARPPLQRTPLQNSSGTAGQCDGAFTLDWNAYQQSHAAALGNPWQLGVRVYAQAWYRNPGTGVTALSNALELTAQP